MSRSICSLTNPASLEIRRALSRWQPQVVHVHENHSPRLLALASGYPTVFTVHDPVNDLGADPPRAPRAAPPLSDWRYVPGSSCWWTLTADPSRSPTRALTRCLGGPAGSRSAEPEQDRRDGLSFRPFSPCALPTPLPDGRYSTRPAEAQLSRQIPKAREGDPRNHRADAYESVQVTSNYMANLGQDAHRQRACDKGQFRT
jgi:hypothetical protein